METGFKGKTGELTNNGIMVFFNKFVKPKLRPLLAEAFCDVEYLISQNAVGNAYSHLDPDYEDEQKGISPEGRDDLVTLRFRAGWGALMAPYKRILMGEIFNKLLNTTAGYLSELSEKRRGYAGGSVNWGLSKRRVTLQVSWMS